MADAADPLLRFLSRLGHALLATLFSIVAIALGSLIGSGIYNALFDPNFRHAESVAASVWQRWRRRD